MCSSAFDHGIMLLIRSINTSLITVKSSAVLFKSSCKGVINLGAAGVNCTMIFM